ncbi:LptF/LptG family permease [Neotamlana laminarinivorans]|uniref:LptF/LptG family permease n=1 Tax=Neotamlana laminarinivorans TaxID=2883124 RepID=A0A9X1I1I5_9FLAO|nr:LptF/LptG family permease [Tamlana laminarinivorans]MCB4800089.1 LptF/LptG family permease [Tamlana laminarinivorans]
MKILDRYILTTYLRTFLSVFIILMLIFVLQTIWLYIRELSGKDLDIIVIVKFLVYFMPKLIPLVLPLTILLASIMVFGSFAENYEFAAMKSTGISLQRAMSGLSVFIVILAVITFFFSNNVIPWAEYNSYNLRKNIAKLKPAMLLAKGQFNEVGLYNIKFTEKTGERGQYLKNVTIHVRSSNGRENATTIISKDGELASKEDSNVLKLILTDGYYYSDLSPKTKKDRDKKPFAKSKFETKIINIDLSELNDVDIDEKSQTDKYSMLNVSGLNKSIDSLIEKSIADHGAFAKNLHQRSSLISTKNISNTKKDSTKVSKDSTYLGNLLDIFDTKKKIQIIDNTTRTLSSPQQIIKSKETNIKIQDELLNRHFISLHEKFALGFACIILFFVGAPLGALIRKGGIGLPMVVAILLFLTYHFIGIFATNSAKKGGFDPVLAPWFSTLIMLPLGVFLTKRATADKGLFDFDSVLDPLKKIFKIKNNNSHDYKFLNSKKNTELIDIINNYEALGHDELCRYEAYKVLKQRGNDIEDLKEKGLLINNNYKTSENLIFNEYTPHSTYAIALFITGVVLLILHFIFKNNKLPSVAAASIQLSIMALILFVVYYVKSLVNLYSFYKFIKKPRKKPHIILVILGFPLYFISYLIFKEKVREDLKLNYLESLK